MGLTTFDSEVDLAGTFTGSDQIGIFDLTAFTVQVMASKKFSVLTVYGSLGFNTASTNVEVKGTYEIQYSNPLVPIQILKDPVNLGFGSSGVRATAGVRFKFSFFGLHADYTLYKHNVFTVGISFGFREN